MKTNEGILERYFGKENEETKKSILEALKEANKLGRDKRSIEIFEGIRNLDFDGINEVPCNSVCEKVHINEIQAINALMRLYLKECPKCNKYMIKETLPDYPNTAKKIWQCDNCQYMEER